MGALTAALASASVASSFVLGLLIAKWAREELKPGRPYFALAQHALLAIVLGIIVWNLNRIAGVCSAAALFAILWLAKFKHSAITGFPLGAAMLSKSAIPAIFVYGLVSGTMAVIRKTQKQVLLEAVIFAILAWLAMAF